MVSCGAGPWRLPAAEIHFTDYNQGRIHIHYVKSSFLSARLRESASTLSANLEAGEKQTGAFLKDGLDVYLYNNWEEKGNDVQAINFANADDTKNAIYCIVNAHFDGLREGVEYELLLRSRLGNPFRPEWGRIAATAFSGVWNQKTLEEWARFLLARDLPPEIPQVLTGKGACSDFLVYPWSALFARFTKDTFGWNAFQQLYLNGNLPQQYEAEWERYLKSLGVASVPAYTFHPEFQKGMTFAYWNSYDAGYPTHKSRQSLELLRKMGANWIAAVPYGFMESEDSPLVHFAGNHIGGESDESMAAVSMDAHELKMKILLKPQIWIHHGSWTGRIDFPDDSSWRAWMQSYENWIVHYAILAELIQADQFCIGTELVQATLEQPDRWRALIARVRRIYHGPLVYAANWGKEFEGLNFWDALDYIGLDNYYPVRTDRKDGLPEMMAAFQQQKEKIHSVARQYGKPVLFTEIGYHSTDGAGMGSQEDQFSGYNEQLQAECYRLALETYWSEPWFSGMYWWKWFSNPEDSGRQADEDSPHGKSAEKVLQIWYRKER